MPESSFSPVIFRGYDIRGKVGRDFSPQTAYLIGRAFGTVVRRANGQTVCVVRDGRLSSADLEKELIEGLVASGIEVSSLGLGPTPFLYWAERFLHTDAAIMITGSHNPPEENGFKFSFRTKPFFGDQIQRLLNLIEVEDFIDGEGTVETHRLLGTYRQDLLDKLLWNERSLTIAWDPGHGAVGSVLSDLLEELPGFHFIIHGTVDGRFPARSPDPSRPQNLKTLKELVLNKHCDVGLAFDGDGDRLVVMDNQGRLWEGDEVLTLLAYDILQITPSIKIIADVKCSQILLDFIADFSGKVFLSKTGHVHVKQMMAKEDALLGGEMSGHFFFRDQHFGYDDGIYAALRFLTLLTRLQEPLSTWLSKLPTRYASPEMRILCAEEKKFSVIKNLQATFAKQKIPFNHLDGLRVEEKEGWWLLRASNTQAVLVARCESETSEGLNILKKKLATLLQSQGIESADIEASYDH